MSCSGKCVDCYRAADGTLVKFSVESGVRYEVSTATGDRTVIADGNTQTSAEVTAAIEAWEAGKTQIDDQMCSDAMKQANLPVKDDHNDLDYWRCVTDAAGDPTGDVVHIIEHREHDVDTGHMVTIDTEYSLNGATWAGDVATLKACAAAGGAESLYGEPTEMCDGGTKVLRYFLKDDEGLPTTQFVDRVAASQAAHTASADIVIGDCDELTAATFVETDCFVDATIPNSVPFRGVRKYFKDGTIKVFNIAGGSEVEVTPAANYQNADCAGCQ